MDAINVTPEKWRRDKNYPIRILIDNGNYSVVWGKFSGTRCLGVRWNGEEEVGYPSQGSNPTWYVEPDFIAIGILHNLHSLAIVDRTDDYNIDNILFAISELSDKMTKS
jgi:hypothetical protein